MKQTEKPSSAAKMQSQSRNEEGEDVVASSTAESLAVSKEPSVQNVDPVISVEEEHKYLTSLKLLAAMISITLVGFLMLLDTSIVSTVSWCSLCVRHWGQSC